MKAAVYETYGPPEVLEIKEVTKPVPTENEVLIRVHYSTVNRTDSGFRSAKYFVSRFFTGLLKPKRPIGGSEFAGEVVEVGANVREYQAGDRVFGFDDVRGGGHAEFKTEPADGRMAKMPENFDFHTMAAAGEGASYALTIIEGAGVTKGQNVLVYGASGAIGSAGLQILKSMGVQVTAVCGTKNVELMKSLGADRVIDYQTEDFTQTDEKFDLIFDAVGKSSYGACKKLMKPKGSYVSTELGPHGENIPLAIWFGVTGSRKVIFPIPKVNKATIEHIKALVGSGAFKPVIDRTYPLEEIVEAAKYVETGQKTGNVVVEVG